MNKDIDFDFNEILAESRESSITFINIAKHTLSM